MKVVWKIKTHVLYSVASFLENGAIYEKMWKNTVQPGMPQMTGKIAQSLCVLAT